MLFQWSRVQGKINKSKGKIIYLNQGYWININFKDDKSISLSISINFKNYNELPGTVKGESAVKTKNQIKIDFFVKIK